MVQVIEDNYIYATRGDIAHISISLNNNGKPYTFQVGEVLRIKVYEKKNANNVVLQKDFPVTAVTQTMELYLDENDTKIGEVISKPKDYWYEIELNPFDNPQTIIGYDEDGPKIFRLFPEGADKEPYVPDPEVIAVIDTELDMASERPVQNQVIARAFLNLQAGYQATHNAVAKLHVTPEMYGAIGDGKSDDTVAIQTAINEAMARGTNVYLPAGDYVITDTLTVSTMNNAAYEDVKNVFISGAGASKTILRAKMNGKPVLRYENANNGNYSNAVAEGIGILPFDDSYKFQFDGIHLVNSVGNLYRDIIISNANIGILLTTSRATNVSALNTGYCEQNVFEDVRVNGCVACVEFRAGENDDKTTSFHGNIFERVALSANSDTTAGGKATALNFASGYIYNCTFNVKCFLSGANAHLMHINCTSGTNAGNISYECFTADGAKISTGNWANAQFILNGNIYGLGNIVWTEYSPVAIGEIKTDGSVVASGDTLIGKEKLWCFNLVPPHDIGAIATYSKSYEELPLYNNINNVWAGNANNFVRYRNTNGSTEHGYIMACKEADGAGARFILGDLPETAKSMSEFVPGFYFYANGKNIESAKTGARLGFTADGMTVNGSKIRTEDQERFVNDYTGRMRFGGGFTIIWGAFEAEEGAHTTDIDISVYNLKKAFGVHVTSQSVTTDGHKNYSAVSGLTNTGFQVNTENTSKDLVYWVVYGYTG